ncbi:helix-turn-helix domain-containing protein [Roseateles sp. P5_E7]
MSSDRTADRPPSDAHGLHSGTGDPPELTKPCRLWTCDGLSTVNWVTEHGHFGDRLVAAMQLRGNFKATALACALHVNEAAISRWKRGGPITLTHATLLCDTLDISMDWLIRGLGQQVLQARPGTAHALPSISERTADEMRALLRFIEHQSGGRVALDASDEPPHARAA